MVWPNAAVNGDQCNECAELLAQAPRRRRQADPDWLRPRATERPEASRGQDRAPGAGQHGEDHHAVESQSAPESLAPSEFRQTLHAGDTDA